MVTGCVFQHTFGSKPKTGYSLLYWSSSMSLLCTELHVGVRSFDRKSRSQKNADILSYRCGYGFNFSMSCHHDVIVVETYIRFYNIMVLLVTFNHNIARLLERYMMVQDGICEGLITQYVSGM